MAQLAAIGAYPLVLFLHLSALLAAISAGALVHFAELRLQAVRYLAAQSAHGVSHELVLTASGDRWLP